MVERSRRDPRHDILFEAVEIGPKVLRNRFFQVPHCTGFGDVKPFSQAAHRGVKAEGGWAAVCTEYAPVSVDADESPWASARMWDESDARNLGLMAERAHHYGALAGIELHHSGAHGFCGEARTVQIAPSQLASDLLPNVVPRAMDADDITRVIADWVRAARAARDVGFDIVYVYGGHSYLPMQFLSPFYNHRDDLYGGNFENRSRFWLELLTALKDAVGEECAIACRIAIDALGPAGVGLDEGLM
ncbi:MAG: FAD-dependent oxidoreductase, partial [Acidimicrobiales bacterium]